MSSVVTPNVGQRVLLRQIAEYLADRCAGMRRIEGELIWGVRPRLVRTYVWAVYLGQDPRGAILRRIYGPVRWDEVSDLARRHVAAIVAWLEDEVRTPIPRRAGLPGSLAA